MADLIRESAIEAVMTGEEAITKKLMDTTTIIISKQRTSTAEPTPKPQTVSTANNPRQPHPASAPETLRTAGHGHALLP